MYIHMCTYVIFLSKMASSIDSAGLTFFLARACITPRIVASMADESGGGVGVGGGAWMERGEHGWSMDGDGRAVKRKRTSVCEYETGN